MYTKDFTLYFYDSKRSYICEVHSNEFLDGEFCHWKDDWSRKIKYGTHKNELIINNYHADKMCSFFYYNPEISEIRTLLDDRGKKEFIVKRRK